MSTAKPTATRTYITINPELFAVLGLDPATARSAAIDDHLSRTAAMIRRAAAIIEPKFSRGEWNLLADATNGLIWADEPAGLILKAQVEDAHADHRIGDKWSVNIDDLVAKIDELGEIEAEAIAVALRWFWDHHEGADMTADRWWTVAFRTRAAKGG